MYLTISKKKPSKSSEALYQLLNQVEIELNLIQSRPSLNHWQDWISHYLVNDFYYPMADAHIRFWEHISELTAHNSINPYFMILGRGGGKSTNLESVCIYLGAKGIRRFIVYVRGTQDSANTTIDNIAQKMSSRNLISDYPSFTSRRVTQYGYSAGWKSAGGMLTTDSGIRILGYGLDRPFRGLKFGNQRPDLIIFDDIDGLYDTPETVDKKIKNLQQNILPAGDKNVVILGGQNLVHANGIFYKLYKNEIDLLHNRVVDGPIPVVKDLGREVDPETNKITFYAGTPTWEGQGLETAESLANDIGIESFLKECQHEIDVNTNELWAMVKFKHVHFDDIKEGIIEGCLFVDPAVTNTDRSDNYAISAAVLGGDNGIYNLYNWQSRSGSVNAIKKAILIALEFNLDVLGVETDQGGDLWRDAYYNVLDDLIADSNYPTIDNKTSFPTFLSVKAGSVGSKVHRNRLLRQDYLSLESKIYHVIYDPGQWGEQFDDMLDLNEDCHNTCNILEHSLYNFGSVAYDLPDSWFWCWQYLNRLRR